MNLKDLSPGLNILLRFRQVPFHVLAKSSTKLLLCIVATSRYITSKKELIGTLTFSIGSSVKDLNPGDTRYNYEVIEIMKEVLNEKNGGNL